MSERDGSTFDPHGPVAEVIADLWWLMFGIGTAVFVLVVALLVAGLFRRRRNEREDGATTSFRAWLVGGGVVMPAVILVIILAVTVVSTNRVWTDEADDALVVEIVGHRWWWEVRYPEQGVTTANEVHIPVGRRVAFRLTSADVIHSFWVPALGGKMDLLPDGTNTLVLEASKPGEHRSFCAEFCGLQHAKMGLVVVAEAPDSFASWLEGQGQLATRPESAPARRGHDIFLEHCASCHTIEGTSAQGDRGPDLTHLATRATIGAGVVPNTPENLAAWVSNPHDLKQGVRMPEPDLTGEELEAVLAYLETLE